jgi:Na+-transporting NADH:ubiquinone oxidoreductase subunit NqrC
VGSVIELIPAEVVKPKKGRPSKAEKKAADRAKASEAVAALLDSEPTKEDIREYFAQRVEELTSL